MKIDICLLACDDNEKYYSFFPYVKSFWEKKLGIKCLLIFIGNILPDILKPYEDNIIVYKPINNLHTAFIAQNIRLLYPALLDCSEGVIIADIDIIPLSQKYFINKIESYPNESFINYTYEEKCDQIKEYYMCYNVAPPKIWGKIFGINKLDDIEILLKDWYLKIEYIYDDKFRSKCKGFHNDQLMLYKYLNTFKKEINLVFLQRNTRRLHADGRKRFINKNKIKNETNNDIWDDFHIPKNFYKDDLHSIIN